MFFAYKSKDNQTLINKINKNQNQYEILNLKLKNFQNNQINLKVGYYFFLCLLLKNKNYLLLSQYN